MFLAASGWPIDAAREAKGSIGLLTCGAGCEARALNARRGIRSARGSIVQTLRWRPERLLIAHIRPWPERPLFAIRREYKFI